MPEIREGQTVALLQELHILTRDGKMNQDSRRKLKQVSPDQFIEPLLRSAAGPRRVAGRPRRRQVLPASSSTTCSSRTATMVRTSTASKHAKSWCSARRNWRRKLPRHVVPAPVRGRVHGIEAAAQQIDIVTACMPATRPPMTPSTSR
jgi:hypothetical protein